VSFYYIVFTHKLESSHSLWFKLYCQRWRTSQGHRPKSRTVILLTNRQDKQWPKNDSMSSCSDLWCAMRSFAWRRHGRIHVTAPTVSQLNSQQRH